MAMSENYESYDQELQIEGFSECEFVVTKHTKLRQLSMVRDGDGFCSIVFHREEKGQANGFLFVYIQSPGDWMVFDPQKGTKTRWLDYWMQQSKFFLHLLKPDFDICKGEKE
jgi:hypothetical protein